MKFRAEKFEDYNIQSEELSDWIQSYRWDYFITVTCKRPRRDSVAFIRDIGGVLSERENQWWSNPDGLNLPTRMFLACEPHRWNRNLHAHGLLAGVPLLYQPNILQKPLERYFGYSRVEKVRNHADVATYCSKYVVKLGGGDSWNILGTGW